MQEGKVCLNILRDEWKPVCTDVLSLSLPLSRALSLSRFRALSLSRSLMHACMYIYGCGFVVCVCVACVWYVVDGLLMHACMYI